jgi:hypothetical protein
MVKFENFEKWDMLTAYIESGRNLNASSNLYYTRYPERRQPNTITFKKIEHNLKNYGSFNKPRPRNYHKVNVENRSITVLGFVEANPNSSSREIERDVGISKTSALRILKQNKYRPYKIRINHHLYPGDFQRRLNFCHWYIRQCQYVDNFKFNVIWTDEARVTSDGIFNRYNNHHWSDENHHVTKTRRRQGRFGFNIFCLMMGGKLYYFTYDDNLTSARYVELLRIHLLEFLDDIPLQNRASAWFQLDGAPPHNAILTRNFLEHFFFERWIGTHGPIKWPPRSPDITPLDFFLWGFLKNQIYTGHNNTINELRENVATAFRKVTTVMSLNAINSIQRRCEKCIEHGGGQFESVL